MADLISTTELLKHFKRPKSFIEAALKKAGVVGSSMKYGTGNMLIYERAPALAAVEAAIKVAPAAAAPAPAPSADASVLEALQELNEKVDNLALSFGQLFDQNSLLLRAHGDTRAEVVAKFDAVLAELRLGVLNAATRVTHLPPPSEPAPPPVKPPKHNPEPQSSRVTKPRIAIVGLNGTQQTEIDREYSSLFDISFIEMGMANKHTVGEKVARAQSVFLCASSATGSISALVSVTGARLVRVNGISSLRDRLTELYVKLSDKEKTAA